MISQAPYTDYGLVFFPMDINDTWARVCVMKKALNLESDMDFYRLCEIDKGHGAQWKSGMTKTIGAEYAFRLQEKTGFQAEWIMLGTGPQRLDKHLQVIARALPILNPAITEGWAIIAQIELDKAKDAHVNVG